MTRHLLALAALLLASGGCTDPSAPEASTSAPPASETSPEASGDDFDAQAWLEAAAGIAFDPETIDPESDETQAARALANELNDAVEWKRACDTYLDYETGEPIYEPLTDDMASWVRGTLDVGRISDTEAVVAVTCDFGAYQGSYALVHIRGTDATLLKAKALGEAGRPLPRTIGTFSTPDWDDLGSGTLSTFGRARGLGDCGTLATYALPASGDLLEIREVRQRECADDIPEPLPPPSEWPIVYTAE